MRASALSLFVVLTLALGACGKQQSSGDGNKEQQGEATRQERYEPQHQEMVALLALMTTRTGQWFGLDAIVGWFFKRREA